MGLISCVLQLLFLIMASVMGILVISMFGMSDVAGRLFHDCTEGQVRDLRSTNEQLRNENTRLINDLQYAQQQFHAKETQFQSELAALREIKNQMEDELQKLKVASKDNVETIKNLKIIEGEFKQMEVRFIEMKAQKDLEMQREKDASHRVESILREVQENSSQAAKEQREEIIQLYEKEITRSESWSWLMVRVLLTILFGAAIVFILIFIRNTAQINDLTAQLGKAQEQVAAISATERFLALGNKTDKIEDTAHATADVTVHCKKEHMDQVKTEIVKNLEMKKISSHVEPFSAESQKGFMFVTSQSDKVTPGGLKITWLCFISGEVLTFNSDDDENWKIALKAFMKDKKEN